MAQTTNSPTGSSAGLVVPPMSLQSMYNETIRKHTNLTNDIRNFMRRMIRLGYGTAVMDAMADYYPLCELIFIFEEVSFITTPTKGHPIKLLGDAASSAKGPGKRGPTQKYKTTAKKLLVPKTEMPEEIKKGKDVKADKGKSICDSGETLKQLNDFMTLDSD